jgi:ribosomal protein S18 acetylase RimI-like enzyme
MELNIRKLKKEDCKSISEAFSSQGWNKPVQQYENYLNEQILEKRLVLVALLDNEFAGYLTIKWEPYYPLFKESNIPEIMDLNVLIKFRRNGVATKLMDEAEFIVSKRSSQIGIGVGLIKDYGNAQALYVKRGYIPDCKGISNSEKFLTYGDTVKADDDLKLCLLKELK